MTPKAIRYSSHAAERLKERGISRTDVRWLLVKGEPVDANFGAGAVHMKQRRLGKQDAIIVYQESATGIYIITVMWVE